MSKGMYYDELAGPSGSVLWRSGWRSNVIVESCDTLLAALMKRHEGTEGILYWAVGIGHPSWDASPSIASPTTARLEREVSRQALPLSQMRFIDGDGAPAAGPTNRIEVTAEFLGDDLALEGFVSLREFGLFGGDASDAPDSGFLVDYVVHPRVDLSRQVVLRRRLQLTFEAGATSEGPPDLPPEPVAPVRLEPGMPVNSIGGVGEVYGGMLAAEGIHTIGDLVEIDPLVGIGEIPMVLLREFRAKARLALGLRVDLAPFRALWDRNVSEVLLERPEVLVRTIGGNQVTVRDVARLQEQLAFLQIAMVDVHLRQVTLGQLAGE